MSGPRRSVELLAPLTLSGSLWQLRPAGPHSPSFSETCCWFSAWTEICQEGFFLLLQTWLSKPASIMCGSHDKCSYEEEAPHGGWGTGEGRVWGLRRSWEWTHFAKIYCFVLSQQGCEVTWHSQRRNATKACTGFVADSVSAWPYGLLCVRGDLANPEHDAICQIRPFLLQYLCNTPFMYPQQMADHLRVLSFWKKLSLLCCGFCCCFFFFPDTALFFLMSEVNAVRRSTPGINFGRGHALLTAVDVSCKNACGCVFL